MTSNVNEFDDIMLSLLVGNNNYSWPFPVFLSAMSPLGVNPASCNANAFNMYIELKKKLPQLWYGLIKETEYWKHLNHKCSNSYSNRLVKTWRGDVLHPTELENKCSFLPPNATIINAWIMPQRLSIPLCNLLNFSFWNALFTSEIISEEDL